jgi:hypothetical protein
MKYFFIALWHDIKGPLIFLSTISAGLLILIGVSWLFEAYTEIMIAITIFLIVSIGAGFYFNKIRKAAKKLFDEAASLKRYQEYQAECLLQNKTPNARKDKKYFISNYDLDEKTRVTTEVSSFKDPFLDDYVSVLREKDTVMGMFKSTVGGSISAPQNSNAKTKKHCNVIGTPCPTPNTICSKCLIGNQ